MALKDLTQQAMWLSDSELHSPRSTPLLERDSDGNGTYRPPKIKSLPAVQVDLTLVPSGLRYHKMKTPPTGTPQVFVDRSPDVLSEQTPPSSEGSEDDTFPSNPRGFGKNHKQLCVNSDLNHVSSYGDMITPDSEGFHVPTPRPFSASDLTSLNPHPPNSPVLPSQDGLLHTNSDLTMEDFMSLSDNDCAEQESPLIDLSTPMEETNKSKISDGQSLALPPFSRLTISSISTMTGQSRESTDPMAEAAFACSFSAQSLGYDLIYVVEIKPSRPNMTSKELFAPGGVRKRILVAYGLDRPMELSTEMHIRVLRSKGYQAWENHRADYGNGEYQSGYLIPLHTESVPYRKRSSGLVFGAFRRPKLAQVDDSVPEVPVEDTQRLLDAAMALKNILLKQPNVRRRLKRSKTEPTSPNRYLANEAVEVGKDLVDKTPERYPAGEAAEVGRYSLGHKEPTPEEKYHAGEAVEVRKFLGEEISEKYPVNEAVEVAKPSLDSKTSRTEPSTPERKPSTKSSKPKKGIEGGKKFPLDPGLERPFHAVSRFRPF
jgi:hypothetical protein